MLITPIQFQQLDVQRPNGEAAYGVEVKAWQVGQLEPCTKCQGETDEKGQITFIFPYSEEDRMVFKVKTKTFKLT